MDERTQSRIGNIKLALDVAYAEKYNQDEAATIRAQKLAFTGLRHAGKRRRLSAAEASHMAKASHAGNLAKQEFEARERVLSLDRPALRAKLIAQANQLVPDFQAEAGSWPASKIIEWSTDKETGARTLQIRTKEDLEPGMWFNKHLVLKDGEEPKLFTSIVIIDSPFTKRGAEPLRSESKPTEETYDADYQINLAMQESERILDILLLNQAGNAHDLSQ